MRSAFYALLLVNLVFFIWGRWIDAPVASAPSAPAHALPTLALISNQEGSDAGADRAASTPPVPAATTAVATAAPPAPQRNAPAPAVASVRCRSLGPFMSPALATQMGGRLKARGLAPTDRRVDISINDGYTVYLSEAGDDAAGRQRVLARLARADVDDVHPVVGPQQEARISLGVFTDQARAVRRAEQVRQLGFKPVLDIHQSAVTTHWLDLQLEPNEPTPPLGQLLQELPGGAAAVTPMVAFSDCPAPTAGG